jgi:hypothetical protein
MTKQFSLLLCISLFVLGCFQKISLIQTQRTQVDELYVLARACNKSIYPLSPKFEFAEKQIYSLSELMSAFQPKFRENNFFQDAGYYLLNYPKLSNHPPLPDILSKLTIINGVTSTKNLRYLSLVYFVITLPLLFLLYRRLGLSKEDSLWSLAVFSSLSLVSLVFVFPKNYALWILVTVMGLLSFQHWLTDKKLSKLILSLVMFHLVFQVHYFSALILPFLYALLIYKSKPKSKLTFLIPFFYSLTLIIYYPIIKLQKSFTSKYFDNFDGYLLELKALMKTLVTIFGLNFKSVFGIIICVVVFYLFAKNNNTDKRFFLILTAIPSAIIFFYDCLLHHNMIGNFRYSSLSLIFLPVFLSLVLKNKYILSALLALNICLPQISKIQYLNSSNFLMPKKEMQALADSSKNDQTIIALDSYGIYNLLFLYDLNELNPSAKNVFVITEQFPRENLVSNYSFYSLNYNNKKTTFSLERSK